MMCVRCMNGNKIDHSGKVPVLDRFLTYIQPDGDCLRWTGGRSDGRYGMFWDGKRYCKAHVFAFEQVYGPVEQGKQLDHFKYPADCIGELCVNTAHLRLVTARENVLRSNCPASWNLAKTECVNGHEFTDENTYVRLRGGRMCMICNREASRRYQAAARD